MEASKRDIFTNPFGIRFGNGKKNFRTQAEALNEYVLKDEWNSSLNVDLDQGDKQLGGKLRTLHDGSISPNVGDTSVGGTDSFNALWAFGVDDDIIHPISEFEGHQIDENGNEIGHPKPYPKGLGRVYSETYINNQRIIWMQFGVPAYNPVLSFYTNAINSKMSTTMNSGDTAASAIGNLLGEGLAIAVLLPILPLQWGRDFLNSTVNEVGTSNYYDFKPTQVLYYRMVNGILSHLAVSMGLIQFDSAPEAANFKSKVKNVVTQQYGNDNRPTVLRDGPDIFKLLSKRNNRLNKMNNVPDTYQGTDELFQDSKLLTKGRPLFHNKNGGINETLSGVAELGAEFADSFKGAALGAYNFVGFRIENGTDTSESITNQSGESSIASKINSHVSSSRDKRFTVNDLKTGISAVDAAKDLVLGFIKGAADTIGIGGIADIATGNGFINIPDVWKSSSFNKSYNFNVQLRAKYGDPVSIFQSIYVPLSMLLSAALPRSVGDNAYTSPFLINAYAKGMFAIPLGIIESMTIKRGLPEHGWATTDLPTAVDVSFSIKDLSPAFFLSLHDAGFLSISLRNTTMQEYLNTLSALGVAERTFLKNKLVQKIAVAWTINKNTTFSPTFWGINFGSKPIVRLVSNFAPGWRVP